MEEDLNETDVDWGKDGFTTVRTDADYDLFPFQGRCSGLIGACVDTMTHVCVGMAAGLPLATQSGACPGGASVRCCESRRVITKTQCRGDIPCPDDRYCKQRGRQHISGGGVSCFRLAARHHACRGPTWGTRAGSQTKSN